MFEELNSHKRKFDEIADKLQSMEESISKIPKFDDNERKSLMTLSEKSFLSNNQSKEKEDSRKGFVLKDVFKNMANFEVGDFATTQNEEHFNVNWHMQFRMMGNDYEKVTKTTKYCFENEESFGCDGFLEWTNLDYYLVDDNLTAEVEVEILEMTGFEKKKIRRFDESQKDVSDVVLIVKDTKFYVSKLYLAAQSSFFKTLFLGNFCESKMSEIPLTGIEPEDFQHFLEVLYGESAIDDTTVEGVTFLSDMYDAQTVMRRCEEFLLEKSKKTLKKKLQLATRYHMEKLKEKSMGDIDSIEDIRSVIPENVDDYDQQTTFELLGKLNYFH
ncbi:unnamed protein product [Caenorhabditis nigoni]